MQALQLAVNRDSYGSEERFRGGHDGNERDQRNASLEDLVGLAAAGEGEFAAAIGLDADADILSTIEDKVDEAACSSRAWTEERLGKPLFPGSDKTVKQAVYTFMKAAAGSVRTGTLDELIKAFKTFLPPENDLPGCATCTRRK